MRKLPVVFVCENNLYGEWTPMAAVTAGGAIAPRGARLRHAGERIDGNDVLAVREAALDAVERARAGEGPTLHRVPAPTGTRATRGSTRGSTGRRRRSRPGSRATRSRARASALDDPRRRREPQAARASRGRARRSRTAPAPLARPPRKSPRHEEPPMTVLSYREAIREALAAEMERDPRRVVLFGEDVAPGGVVQRHRRVSSTASARDRVVDTPISEMAFTGAAFGAAADGHAPGRRDHVRRLPRARHRHARQPGREVLVHVDGQASVPLVVRRPSAPAARLGACHSQTPTGWFLGEPGLKFVAPSDAGRRGGRC